MLFLRCCAVHMVNDQQRLEKVRLELERIEAEKAAKLLAEQVSALLSATNCMTEHVHISFYSYARVDVMVLL